MLVVGTTADYIDIIRRRFPGRAIFLTDSLERAKATEPCPPLPTELLCNLACHEETLVRLREHLNRWRIELSGITCFDCESLALAAQIARALSLPYVSLEAVVTCRNKYACKKMWHEAGLPCPDAELVRDVSEAESFLNRIGDAAVLKPLAGSGSEYVFPCSNNNECRTAFCTLESKLSELQNNPKKPLYSRDRSEAIMRHAYVIEEFIQGIEYSCDFVLDGDRLEIVRVARKVPACGLPFGTTLAYVVPSDLPPTLDPERFRCQLRNASRVLGLERAMCMLDFIVREGEALMIEMTPRPGGDCLPPLLLKSAGLDMLGFALDFAEGHFPAIPEPSRWKLLVGLRLFAKVPGTIAELDTEALQEDRRVIEYHIKHEPGHRVILPPEDYDSQLLGHVIFEPLDPDNIEEECAEITQLLEIEMEKT